MKCPVCQTQRPRSAAATREAMLASARRRFLEESYENVGLRDIAGDVGVDATLVNRYFGSKEELFKEVLRQGKPKTLEEPPDDLATHFACMMADESRNEDPYAVERLLIILRSASSPQAAAIVAKTVRKDMLEPFAQLLDGENAELRATLAMSVMIGTTVLRSILGVTVTADCDQRLVYGKMLEMFRTAMADTPPPPCIEQRKQS